MRQAGNWSRWNCGKKHRIHLKENGFSTSARDSIASLRSVTYESPGIKYGSTFYGPSGLDRSKVQPPGHGGNRFRAALLTAVRTL